VPTARQTTSTISWSSRLRCGGLAYAKAARSAKSCARLKWSLGTRKKTWGGPADKLLGRYSSQPVRPLVDSLSSTRTREGTLPSPACNRGGARATRAGRCVAKNGTGSGQPIRKRRQLENATGACTHFSTDVSGASGELEWKTPTRIDTHLKALPWRLAAFDQSRPVSACHCRCHS
jgi:hypothetical protein